MNKIAIGSLIFAIMSIYCLVGKAETASLQYVGGELYLTAYSIAGVTWWDEEDNKYVDNSTYNPPPVHGTNVSLSGGSYAEVPMGAWSPLGYANTRINIRASLSNAGINSYMDGYLYQFNAGYGSVSGTIETPSNIVYKVIAGPGEKNGEKANLRVSAFSFNYDHYFNKEGIFHLKSQYNIFVNSEPILAGKTEIVGEGGRGFKMTHQNTAKIDPNEINWPWPEYPPLLDEPFEMVFPITIGDTIELNYYGDMSFKQHWCYGDLPTDIQLSAENFPSDQVLPPGAAPLPGTAFLLGTGLGCLSIYRLRKLNTKN